MWAGWKTLPTNGTFPVRWPRQQGRAACHQPTAETAFHPRSNPRRHAQPGVSWVSREAAAMVRKESAHDDRRRSLESGAIVSSIPSSRTRETS